MGQAKREITAAVDKDKHEQKLSLALSFETVKIWPPQKLIKT